MLTPVGGAAKVGWIQRGVALEHNSECDSRAHETQGLHQLNKCYAESSWGAAGGGWIQENCLGT